MWPTVYLLDTLAFARHSVLLSKPLIRCVCCNVVGSLCSRIQRMLVCIVGLIDQDVHGWNKVKAEFLIRGSNETQRLRSRLPHALCSRVVFHIGIFLLWRLEWYVVVWCVCDDSMWVQWECARHVHKRVREMVQSARYVSPRLQDVDVCQGWSLNSLSVIERFINIAVRVVESCAYWLIVCPMARRLFIVLVSL